MKPAFLEAALRRALREPSLRITGSHSMGGGCIHAAFHLTTTSGQFFAKWNPDCPPDLFPSEAKGLEALRDAASELVIPRVVAVDPGFLILEYLRPRPDGPRDDEGLGRGLAAIHRRSAARFGFEGATYCGTTRQDNTACDSWAAFYAQRRLCPLLDALALAPEERRPFDRLIDRLPEILPPSSPPSLIHGDLWSGNVLDSAKGPGLVDPACAYADREMEFGITTLFGGLSQRAWAAYEEAWPLPAAWRERNDVYQIYHLLNHALLFGGGYLAQARERARRQA